MAAPTSPPAPVRVAVPVLFCHLASLCHVAAAAAAAVARLRDVECPWRVFVSWAVTLAETFSNADASQKGQFVVKSSWTDDNGDTILSYEVSVCIV